MRAVFGDAPPPISSNKSMIGHTLSAAGAIEAVFSLLAMRDGKLPPTINHETPGPGDRPRRGAERGARGEGGAGAVQLLRLRRAECLPRPRRGAEGLTGGARAAAVRRPRRAAGGDGGAAAAGPGRDPAPDAGRGAEPHRRLGLARHGLRQAQPAHDHRRRGGGRGGRRSARAWTGWRVGQRAAPYGALTCGHCRACREGRDNLCENVAGRARLPPRRLRAGAAERAGAAAGAGAGGRRRRGRRLRRHHLLHRRAHAVRQCEAGAGRDHPGAGRRAPASARSRSSMAKALGCTVIATAGVGREVRADARRARRRPRGELQHRPLRERLPPGDGQARRRRGVRACRRRDLGRAACCPCGWAGGW